MELDFEKILQTNERTNQSETLLTEDDLSSGAEETVSKVVQQPAEAGSFADMFGTFLGGLSTKQQNFLNEAIKAQKEADPVGFAKRFGVTSFESPNFINKALYGTEASAPRGLRDVGRAQLELLDSLDSDNNPTEETLRLLPNFDAAAFADLKTAKSDTELAAAQRRRFLQDAGENRSIGSRITDMYDDGLSTGQQYKMLQLKDDAEIDDFLRRQFGKEARLLSPIAVGVDAAGDTIYEKIYQKRVGGQVHRLKVYDEFTGLRGLIADIYERSQNPDGDAAKRINGLIESVGASTINNTLTPSIVLPTLLSIAFPAFGAARLAGLGIKASGGSSILKQMGMALARGGSLAAANLTGQGAERGIAGEEAFQPDALNYADAAIEFGIGFMGPTIFQVMKAFFNEGENPLTKILGRTIAGKQERSAFVDQTARAFGEDFELPAAALLLQKGFGRGFARAIFGLTQGEGAEEFRNRAGKQMFQTIRKEIVDKPVGRLTPNDMRRLHGSYISAYNEQSGKSFIDSPEGINAAKAARENMLDMEQGFRNQAKALYGYIVDSAKSKNLKFEEDFQNILDNRLGQLQKLSTKVQERVVTRVKDDAGKITTEGIDRIPERLAAVANLIERMAPLGKAKSVTTGEFSSVMDQLFTLKTEIKLATDEAGGNIPEAVTMRETLDEMISSVIELPAFTARNSDAKQYFSVANDIYETIGSLKASNFYQQAARDGRTDVFKNFISPLMAGDTDFELDTLITLKNILEFKPELLKTAAVGRTVKGKPGAPLAEIKKNFRKNLTEAAYKRMFASADVGSFLSKFLNTKDLRTADASNEAFAFLFPNKKMREQILDTAVKKQRVDREAALFTDAVQTVNPGDLSSADIAKTFYDKAAQAYAEAPDAGRAMIERYINNYPGSESLPGKNRLLPQLQSDLLQRVLSKATGTVITREGSKEPLVENVVNFNKLQATIAELQKNPFDKEYMDIVLSQGTGLQGVSDINKLLTLAREVGEVFTNLLPASGESIAGAELGMAPTQPGFLNTKTLFDYGYRLLVTRKMADIFLEPFSRDRIEKIINSDALPNRKAEILAGYLIRRRNQKAEEDRTFVNIDGTFYTKENYNGPQKAPIFREFERLKKANENLLPDVLRKQESQAPIRPDVDVTNIQSAPIPEAPVGLNIPAVPATGGQGIAALPAPETVQQLAQVGLPLFGGPSGPG